jgi:hypothetical protein
VNCVAGLLLKSLWGSLSSIAGRRESSVYSAVTAGAGSWPFVLFAIKKEKAVAGCRDSKTLCTTVTFGWPFAFLLMRGVGWMEM